MKQAVIYTRFSPRRNADKSESCETQEKICRDHATGKGYLVKSVHEDRERSGSDPARPGLAAAIKSLSRGNVLLVYKRDRIARDTLLAELTNRQVSAAGSSIEAVTGDIDGDDDSPTVQFVRTIMDAVAQLERKQIGQRTRDAMRMHQSNGRRMSRYAPYGFEISESDNSALVPCQLEQLAIRRIFAYLDKGIACYSIAKKMNEQMPELARAGQWSAKTIGKIAQRRRGQDG